MKKLRTLGLELNILNYGSLYEHLSSTMMRKLQENVWFNCCWGMWIIELSNHNEDVLQWEPYSMLFHDKYV